MFDDRAEQSDFGSDEAVDRLFDSDGNDDVDWSAPPPDEHDRLPRHNPYVSGMWVWHAVGWSRE